MNELSILNGEDVARTLPMSSCIDAVEQAMVAVSGKAATTPLRMITPLVDQSGMMAVMPSSASRPAVYGIKVLSLHPQNPQHGRPAIQGFIALFEHTTGAPFALVDGASVTAIRTAAASGLATKLLSREDSRTHGIMGTGVQAFSHASAIATARPSVERIVVWGRDKAKAETVAAEISRRSGTDCEAACHPSEAAACDIVSTVTGATEPILRSEWVNPGAHINAVGSHSAIKREIDSETVAKAKVYVDLLDSAINEAGDILIPIDEGHISADHIVGELGALCQGDIVGRTDDKDITLFKSLGFAAEDIFSAFKAFEAANAQGGIQTVSL